MQTVRLQAKAEAVAALAATAARAAQAERQALSMVASQLLPVLEGRLE
jgi:hypothetical protein